VAIYLSNESYSSFIVADRLDYDDSDSEINLNFQNGILYQDIFTSESSVVSYFGQLKIPVINDNKPVSGLSFTKLFDFSTKSSKSETQWNISIPITIFILLILGVTLSKVGPRQGRLSVLLPAIFVYILYLSLLILARETYSENSFNAQNYIWYVHIIFFGISLMTLFKTHLSQTLRPNIILLNNNFVRLLLFGLISLIFFWVLG
jgi:lipopolysaccharide export LptBFGC system permease protein LptF